MRSIKYFQLVALTVALSVPWLLFTTASSAQEKQFDRIVVFGTSLSDSGNAFTLVSDQTAFGIDAECDMGTPANVPPYDDLGFLLIPDGSYARGGHHVSNGATWIEQFARGQGLSGFVRPALRNTGTEASNYAVGGARAYDFDCRFNLEDQLAAYRKDFPKTSPETLIVIELGSNDVRDVLDTGNQGIIGAALGNIGITIGTLYGDGARKFLLVNVPPIGKTPAVKMIDAMYPDFDVANSANLLSAGFNLGLGGVQVGLSALPGIDIRILDVFTLLNEIIAAPESFGIVNTVDPCVTPAEPPFACAKPDTYLFWDGIHPTKAVHGIVAQRAAEVLAEVPD
jgi:phospholipase/lecithinase/hemolysin